MSGSLADEILRYGRNVRTFFHEGKRAGLMSPLFNVPGRLVVGSYCYYEHLPTLIREMTEAVPASEIGRRMKGLGVRPNYVNLNALMLGYFNGREQLRLAHGLAAGDVLPGDSARDAATLVDFWNGAGNSYVEGPSFIPYETDGSIRILTDDRISELEGSLRVPTDDERTRIRRATAITELYTFILNGEARVGVFNHGPYPVGDGDVLVVKELVGLADDSLPWDLERRPALESVVRVMRIRDVHASIDLFGSLVVEPFQYDDRIVSEALFGRDADGVRELPLSEFEAIAAIAGDAQIRMYEQARDWTAEYQMAYGADLYASFALSFMRTAGVDARDRVRQAFRETAERVVPRLLSGEEPLAILDRIGASDGHLYSPTLEQDL